MRVLFLIFHGFSEYSGITKKIRGQINGFKANDVDVDLAYYDFNDLGERFWVVDDEPVAFLGKGFIGKLCKRIDFKGLGEYIVGQKYDLVYIRSYHNANPFTIRLVQKIKRSGAKVVIEIPTFPYDEEYQSWKVKPKLFVDKLFRYRLMKEIDAVVTFSEDKKIFGQRTIRIANAIDFDKIKIRQNKPFDPVEIHLIGVAEIHYWHGFDRLIKGLGVYYRHNPAAKVYFHLVGAFSGRREQVEIENAIEEFGIEDYVLLHGPLFGEKLDVVFDKCDFAIGSLGRHRTGIQRMQSLKNREYAARGIPFCYAESDSYFDNEPYVIKFSADESPIDISKIVKYLEESKLSPELIRESVLNLSWKNQMKVVISELLLT